MSKMDENCVYRKEEKIKNIKICSLQLAEKNYPDKEKVFIFNFNFL